MEKKIKNPKYQKYIFQKHNKVIFLFHKFIKHITVYKTVHFYAYFDQTTLSNKHSYFDNKQIIKKNKNKK